MAESLLEEIRRRRTFAIISHPDAGKTTLTEKLLLYAGAVDLAGSVRAKKDQRHATSDWMELERQRGISITSTVLQFDYEGYVLNLLDTPGHQDFSEDTYRTLTAADAAVMLIDGAKGIEPQTRKLFEVCRKSGIPIVTFINKMDRPSLEPLDLLDELEREFGVRTVAMNWPLGNGTAFRGVYDRKEGRMCLFDRTEHGATKAPVIVTAPDSEECAALVDPITHRKFLDEMELLEMAGEEFDEARMRSGNLTPVYFGSAANNFGIKLFLDSFLTFGIHPGPRPAADGHVEPDYPHFTGFVFKIQANMDPKHRDSVAFLRVCSGKFEKDMQVHHSRLGTKMRLSRPHKLFARDRDTVEEAYPGDILGLVNPGAFAIGDTVSSNGPVQFDCIPRFAPEHFAILRCPDPSNRKKFTKGLDQLMQEGAVQVFYPTGTGAAREPIVAVVGRLQFDVIQYRLKSEYSVDTVLEPMDMRHARWVDGSPDDIAAISLTMNSRLVKDSDGGTAVLIDSDWSLSRVIEKNPDLKFRDAAPLRRAASAK
ncbi:MAG: peptide chain release factor 3 [Armatimonadetes bacterium]|nr:peptide chain release factor 3 [Armatimonadota bacterium]